MCCEVQQYLPDGLYRFQVEGASDLYYVEALKEMKSDESHTLYINFEHLQEFEEHLAEQILVEFYRSPRTSAFRQKLRLMLP